MNRTKRDGTWRGLVVTLCGYVATPIILFYIDIGVYAGG